MVNTEWAFPFADSKGDRMYSDADFAKFFSAWFVNGVFINVGGGLQIVDSAAGGMKITLKSGAANINGRVYYLNTNTDFTVPVASSTQDRTDSIVLRLDLSARTMNTIYKQSDTSLVRNDSTYEIQLAKINVNKNISEITQSMITDMRTNKGVCGLASPNDPIDVDNFISQFKLQFNEQLNNNNAEFISWFTNLKSQLNSNQASNLQNQINSNSEKIVDNINNIQLLLNKKTLPKWSNNTIYKVGDLVTFNSLGNLTTGLLTNPIFMCMENHTSGTTFPDSNNKQWVLTNIDSSYRIIQNINQGNGLYGDYIRIGNMVNVHNSSSTSSMVGLGLAWSKMANAGTVPNVFLPSYDTDSHLTMGGLQHIFTREFRTDGSIWIRQTWGSKGSVGSGTYFIESPSWITQAVPFWIAGTPT